MPVAFLTEEQVRSYGTFPDDIVPIELAQFFYLDAADWKLIAPRRGDSNRLGVALQLCTARYLGAFLSDVRTAPPKVVQYLAKQLQIDDSVACLEAYQRQEARWDHTAEIRDTCGYHDYGANATTFAFLRMLYTRCWANAERPSVLFDAAVVWLREHQVLLPGISTLERDVARVRDRVASRIWGQICRLITPEQRERLEQILTFVTDKKGNRISRLEELRRKQRRNTTPALLRALARIEKAQEIDVASVDVSHIPARRLKILADYATTSKVSALVDLGEDRRLATLLAFAQAARTDAYDDALNVLDGLIDDVLRSAVRANRKERLRTLRDLDEAALSLADRMTFLLAHRDWPLDELLAYLTTHEADLTTSITRIHELARRPDDKLQKELAGRYNTVRRFLPRLLRTIDFATTRAARDLHDAYAFLKDMEQQKHPSMEGAPLGFVPPGWKRHVKPPGKDIDKKMYTICFLLQLQEGLYKREVFVPASAQWADPRAKLFAGAEWEAVRPTVCQVLHRSPTAKEEIATWEQELDQAYRDTIVNISPTSKVSIETTKDPVTGETTDHLHIDGLEPQPDPPSLKRLRWLTDHLMPLIDLPTLLLEIATRTGFVQEFTHIGEGESRLSDFPISLCAALLIQACNLPVSAVAQKGVPALEADRLVHVMHNYLRPETIARANERLVAVHTQIPVTAVWGGGEVASADGLRFVVPVRSVHTGPDPRHFGPGRGITLINYTMDHFFGFNGAVVTGTIRDSLNVLDGLLEQTSPLLQPHEIMTDSASYSDMVFGLFALLGYRFSPRLADLKDARFWRFAMDADYGPLDTISRYRLDRDLAMDQWDEMLRIVGSLTMGRVKGSEVVKVLSGGRKGNPTTLGRAIMEVGRIAKTAFLLRYINDEQFRRRIQIQLNRGEARHSLARDVYHGRKGELRQSYREGMEEQLGVLGLVVNIIVLWNSLYLDRALNLLREQGYDLKREDIERLSPLGHDHIALLGKYPFTIADYILQGEYLPLREIDETEEFEEVS